MTRGWKCKSEIVTDQRCLITWILAPLGKASWERFCNMEDSFWCICSGFEQDIGIKSWRIILKLLELHKESKLNLENAYFLITDSICAAEGWKLPMSNWFWTIWTVLVIIFHLSGIFFMFYDGITLTAHLGKRARWRAEFHPLLCFLIPSLGLDLKMFLSYLLY